MEAQSPKSGNPIDLAFLESLKANGTTMVGTGAGELSW
jgi:hypothetical protein